MEVLAVDLVCVLLTPLRSLSLPFFIGSQQKHQHYLFKGP